jgi:CRP-like cAMP-binding protein
MFRLVSIVSTYEDNMSDEMEAFVFISQRAVFVFVVIGHWLACFWVMVARDTEDAVVGNWMISLSEQTGLDLDILKDPWRIYCFALKFSIGEITTLASSVSEHAQTNEELLFNCLTNVMGAMIFMQFCGVITDALVKISAKSAIPRGKIKMVMRYLRKRKTPKHLCMRVKKYLHYVISELSERQIDHTILDQVSVSLKAELLSVTIGEQLKHFPVFQNTASRAMEKLSLLSEVLVQTSGDILESDGQLATGLYVIVQGEVFIKNEKICHERYVTSEGYFGQTSLFRSEVRKGFVVSETVTEMIHLTRKAMKKLQEIYPGVQVEIEHISSQLRQGNFDILCTTREEWEKEFELVDRSVQRSADKLDRSTASKPDLADGTAEPGAYGLVGSLRRLTTRAKRVPKKDG